MGTTRALEVTHGDDRQCAVTRERALPALDANHIRPFSVTPENYVRNSVLLRSDVHRLFDAGYVTVIPSYDIEVSDHIRSDFDDAESYLKLHGRRLWVPEDRSTVPRPTTLNGTTRTVPRMSRESDGTWGPDETIAALQAALRKFARERDWEGYHTPRNLAAVIASEAGELLSLFRWGQNAVAERPEEVRRELADVFLGVLRLADVAGTDLAEAGGEAPPQREALSSGRGKGPRWVRASA